MSPSYKSSHDEAETVFDFLEFLARGLEIEPTLPHWPLDAALSAFYEFKRQVAVPNSIARVAQTLALVTGLAITSACGSILENVDDGVSQAERVYSIGKRTGKVLDKIPEAPKKKEK